MKQNAPSSAMDTFYLFGGHPTAQYLAEYHVCDKHLHKEVEIAYVAKGALKVTVKDGTLCAAQGQFICICGSMLHQYTYEEPGSQIIRVKFMKDWCILPFMDEETKKLCQNLYNTTFSTRDDAFIRQLFAQIIPPEDERFGELHIFRKILDLTGYLLGHPEVIRESVGNESTDTDYMDKMLHFLQANCSQPLTLSMLAEYLQLSESYCSKYFKKVVGLNFVDYVNALRVNNALYLLTNTQYSITRIANETGFGSVQSFNRVFKAQNGSTPSDYRKKFKGMPI